MVIDSLATEELRPLATEHCRALPVRWARNRAKQRFYRPELDVLRFFAFLSVFSHHGLPGFVLTRHSGVAALAVSLETSLKGIGRFGVCLFFVLSAYLITELLLREKTSTQTIHIRAFYSRRMLRIWPLYFVFLFLGVLAGHTIPDYRLEGNRILAFLLLAGNWYVARTGCSANPIAPLWSISVEEQFYLIWPWIAKFVRRAWIYSACLTLLPLSYLYLYRLSLAGTDTVRRIWLDSFVQFQFFALGALLALCLRGRVITLPMSARIGLSLSGITAWLVADGACHINQPRLGQSPGSIVAGYAFVGLGCLLLFISFLGVPSHWLPRWLVHLGKISYGLYVFHMFSLSVCWALFWPSQPEGLSLPTTGHTILLAVRAVLILVAAMGMTLSLATLSYRFLEKPFLEMKERFAFIGSRSV